MPPRPRASGRCTGAGKRKPSHMHAGIERLRAVEAVSIVERLPCAATSLVGMWCWVFWHAEGAWFAGEITEFEPEGSGDVSTLVSRRTAIGTKDPTPRAGS